MDNKKLFRVYSFLSAKRELAVELRGKRRGILTGHDLYAKQYQRYARLMRKIEARFLDYSVCYICGWSEGACSCDTYHAPKRTSREDLLNKFEESVDNLTMSYYEPYIDIEEASKVYKQVKERML